MSNLVAVRLRPHTVYRAYGRRGRLLYIGCTSDFQARMRDHRLWSEWAPLATKFVMDGPHDYATARAIEIQAIHEERPRFNRTGRVANYSPRRSTGRVVQSDAA